jgi:hypothetical protein
LIVKRRKRARIGDVLEISTPRGFAYIQFTHRHPVMGCVIRVLPGLFEKRPESFKELVTQRELYVTLFPATVAASRQLIPIVASEEVPLRAQPFPLFKSGNPDPKTKRVKDWWLWDGDRSWRVGELTLEQRALPIRAIWNLAMLVSQIASGWKPEDEVGDPN